MFDLPVRVASPIGLEGLAEIVYEEGWSACVGLLVSGRDSLLADMEWGGAGKQVRRIIGRLKRMASLF